MTSQEWLSIGYDKGIIEDVPVSDAVLFCDAYQKWFLYKMRTVRSGSLDRIECTYKRYYLNDVINNTYVHQIDNDFIVSFIRRSIPSDSVTLKEFRRFYQIINNVLVFALDFNLGHAKIIDWNYVKRFGNGSGFDCKKKDAYIVPDSDFDTLYNSVVYDDVYPLKRSAALCVVLNFYLGLRIGEMAALRFEDFDIKNMCVYINHNEVKDYERDSSGERVGRCNYHVVDYLKTACGRRCVPLVPEALVIFDLICKNHNAHGYDSPYLCYDGTDTIRTRSLARTLTRLCKLTGVQPFNFHLIRKTYASTLHMCGIPTKVISGILGHADMSTTQKFYILNYKDTYRQFYDDICNALSDKQHVFNNARSAI